MTKAERDDLLVLTYRVNPRPYSQVGPQFGLSGERVRQILSERGVSACHDPDHHHRLRHEGAWLERRRELERLLAEGKSADEVARALDVSLSTVSRARIRLGKRLAREVPHLRDRRLLSARARALDLLRRLGLTWDECGLVLGGMDGQQLSAWRSRFGKPPKWQRSDR